MGVAVLGVPERAADGVPLETGLRGCMTAVGIGREMGISGKALSDVMKAAWSSAEFSPSPPASPVNSAIARFPMFVNRRRLSAGR